MKTYEAPPGFVLNPDYLVPELEAQRDALLEALKHVRAVLPHERWADDTKKMVDTAIAAVEQGETK